MYTSLFQSTPDDPFLKGLHRAVQTVVPASVYLAFWERKKAAKRIWCAQGPAISALKRPLTEEAVAYAAADVTPLLEMHRVWSPLVTERAVVAASMARLQRHLHNNSGGAAAHDAERVASSSSSQSSFAMMSARRNARMCRVDFDLVRRRRPCFIYYNRAPEASAFTPSPSPLSPHSSTAAMAYK